MANYVQKGEVMNYTNAGQTTIGYHDVVPLGTRIGVALAPIAVGDVGGVSVVGVWEVPADTAATFAAGDAVYWDTVNNKAVKATGENIIPTGGYAFEAKANGAAVVLAKIGG